MEGIPVLDAIPSRRVLRRSSPVPEPQQAPAAPELAAGLMGAAASLSDGILVCDARWRCIFANPAAADMLHRDLWELEGSDLADLLPDHARRIRHRRSQPGRHFKPVTLRQADREPIEIRVVAADTGSLLHLKRLLAAPEPLLDSPAQPAPPDVPSPAPADVESLHLARQILQAEQHDRRRLSRQLHDHLQQLLVAVQMQMYCLKRTPQHELTPRIESTIQLVGEAIAASRDLTVELSPPVLYDGGLAPALHWLARRMQQDQGLEITLDVRDNVDPSCDLRLAMFRAARQLMQNVAREGGRSASIRLDFLGDDRIVMELAGTGIAVDPPISDDPEASYTDLASLGQRLRWLGGRLTATDSGILRIEAPLGPSSASCTVPSMPPG